jgi:isochorismate synthase
MIKNLRDTEAELAKYDIHSLLKAFLNVAIKYQYPAAFYRLPNKEEFIGIFDFSSSLLSYSIDQLSSVQGFVISPFLNEGNDAKFIHEQLKINFTTRKILIELGKESVANRFLDEVLSFETLYPSMERKDNSNGLDEDHYIQINQKAIEFIKNGKFKKVVLARKKSIVPSSDFHPSNLFESLNESLKDSFNSLVFLPNEGIWVGASPELLVSVDQNNIFRTVALAGTQRANPKEESEVVWTHKEIEEQALVVRYILNCFKSIRLREYEDDGPKTVKAGNLFHLKTDFSVNLKELDYPNLGTTMLKLLHPTSAVCGMPKVEALSFIKEFEGLDRKFYSGFLGPVNIEQETHIFVNIRCAEIEGETINLYSGAGITSESKPERELEETSLKMQLLQKLIKAKE